MPREKEGYRELYASLRERFPGRESISIAEATTLLGVHRATIANDNTFPKVRVGRKIIIPLVQLARWMS